jgi:hypothetical protein
MNVQRLENRRVPLDGHFCRLLRHVPQSLHLLGGYQLAAIHPPDHSVAGANADEAAADLKNIEVVAVFGRAHDARF